MNNKIYDSLDGWREENGVKNSKGEVKKYAGGSEYDPMVEAIKAYEAEQKKKESANKQKADDQGIEL